MAKTIIQDVVPPRRSVRQIVVPGNPPGRQSNNSVPTPPSQGGGNRGRRPLYNPPPSHGERSSPQKGMWVIAGVAVLFLYLTFAVFFAGATITVTPREETATVNGSFIAKQSPAELELPFETMAISAENTTAVPATGEKNLEQKASGIITIYNDFNAVPLRLIKNTRFESPNGLIYRIANSVDVPPQIKLNGTIKPGVIDAEIYADTAGAEYNIESGLFTIPGLKNTPQFSGFYAKTKTPLTGGFDGMTKVVDVTKETEARDTLRKGLITQIKLQAQNEIPEGYVLFETATYTETTSLQNKPADTDTLVLIGEKVTLHGIIFKEATFSQFIARNTIQNFDNAPVHIPDIKTLAVVISAEDTTINPWSAPAIRLSISGNAKIVWDFDKQMLVNDLVGKPKKEINTVLGKYPGIAKAEVTLRPFWKRSFPGKVSKIHVATVGEVTKEESRKTMKEATPKVADPKTTE